MIWSTINTIKTTINYKFFFTFQYTQEIPFNLLYFFSFGERKISCRSQKRSKKIVFKITEHQLPFFDFFFLVENEKIKKYNKKWNSTFQQSLWYTFLLFYFYTEKKNDWMNQIFYFIDLFIQTAILFTRKWILGNLLSLETFFFHRWLLTAVFYFLLYGIFMGFWGNINK